MTTPAQQRETSAISAPAEWKPKLRWLIRRILLLSPSSRPLERPRRMAARIPWRWPRAGQRDEGPQSGARGPGQPGVEVRGRQASVVEVIEQPQLFAQQEGPVEPAVGVAD